MTDHVLSFGFRVLLRGCVWGGRIVSSLPYTLPSTTDAEQIA